MRELFSQCFDVILLMWTKYAYLHVGKVSSELFAKNSVHEVSSCSLDIRRHATIVLTSHSNVTAAREEMYVATTARRSWDGDAIFTTQLSRFMRIFANVPTRLARSRSRRVEHGERSDLPRGKRQRYEEKTMFFHRYRDVCVPSITFDTNFSGEKFCTAKILHSFNLSQFSLVYFSSGWKTWCVLRNYNRMK